MLQVKTVTENQTDEELVANVRTEDSASEVAAAELFLRYESIIKSIASNYFVPGADSDDVEQEGRMGLFKAMLNYNSERSDKFRPFALMCIKQQILTALKTAHRKKNTPLNSYISLDKPIDEHEDESRLPVSDENNPESIFIDRESRETMDYIIDTSLNDSERQILNYYIKGYTYKEIADIIGKNSKAVDNAIQSIKRKLRLKIKFGKR
ncbi:MAG: sigma-70 family RNA polymerase sigma factor [bacterium]|nr:sigma-70 family RNA polymerase sigma factor [bacterium]